MTCKETKSSESSNVYERKWHTWGMKKNPGRKRPAIEIEHQQRTAPQQLCTIRKRAFNFKKQNRMDQKGKTGERPQGGH